MAKCTMAYCVVTEFEQNYRPIEAYRWLSSRHIINFTLFIAILKYLRFFREILVLSSFLFDKWSFTSFTKQFIDINGDKFHLNDVSFSSLPFPVPRVQCVISTSDSRAKGHDIKSKYIYYKLGRHVYEHFAAGMYWLAYSIAHVSDSPVAVEV